ncbi:hypothetical protein J6590_049280 [Homalodisca vitripennis]|nr:hypothetical protein J6590_049280 [Homalodisca vitripennis]
MSLTSIHIALTITLPYLRTSLIQSVLQEKSRKDLDTIYTLQHTLCERAGKADPGSYPLYIGRCTRLM